MSDLSNKISTALDNILFSFIVSTLKIKIHEIVADKLTLYIKSATSSSISSGTSSSCLDKKFICNIKKQKYIEVLSRPIEIVLSESTLKLLQTKFIAQLNNKSYTLTSDDLDNYIQTVQIELYGEKMLRDSKGILYDITAENNIIGRIISDDNIEWYKNICSDI